MEARFAQCIAARELELAFVSIYFTTLLSFYSPEFFWFLHLSCRKFTGKRFQQLRPLPLVFTVPSSRWGRLALQLNPGTFLLGFLVFLVIFLHAFQEAALALRRSLCSLHIFILLARILPLFVYGNADSMVGNTAHTSGFAMVTFVGYSFFEQYPFP